LRATATDNLENQAKEIIGPEIYSDTDLKNIRAGPT
jgi:hypothetical protein